MEATRFSEMESAPPVAQERSAEREVRSIHAASLCEPPVTFSLVRREVPAAANPWLVAGRDVAEAVDAVDTGGLGNATEDCNRSGEQREDELERVRTALANAEEVHRRRVIGLEQYLEALAEEEALVDVSGEVSQRRPVGPRRAVVPLPHQHSWKACWSSQQRRPTTPPINRGRARSSRQPSHQVSKPQVSGGKCHPLS